MQYINHKTFKIAITLLALATGATGFAKPVNLYDQPNKTAKVVGAVDSGSALVPIFTSKNGDWMKVGDPANGNTGWVMVNEMTPSKDGGATSAGVATGFSMTERMVNTKDGPKTYRTIQFTQPDLLDPQQKAHMIQEFEKNRTQAQQYSKQIMDNAYRMMNDFYDANQAMFDQTVVPIFMPILVPTPVPPASNSTVKSATPATVTAPRTSPTNTNGVPIAPVKIQK